MGSIKGFRCSVCDQPAVDMFFANLALVLPAEWMTWRQQEQSDPNSVVVGSGFPVKIVCGRCAPDALHIEPTEVQQARTVLSVTRRRLGFPVDTPSHLLQAEQYPDGHLAPWAASALAVGTDVVLCPITAVSDAVDGKGSGATWSVDAVAVFTAGNISADNPLPRLKWEWIFHPGTPRGERIAGWWVFPSMTVTHTATGYYRRLDQPVGAVSIELTEGGFDALTRSQWNRLKDEGDALLARFHRGPGHPKGPEYEPTPLMSFLETVAKSGKRQPTQPEAASALGWPAQAVYRSARDLGGWDACWRRVIQRA